jgi:predicted DNA-binding ribbon-helix-helix protein
MSSPTVAKRSIYFGGRVTSVTLEDAFWEDLKGIARRRRMKLPDLIGAIDSQRQDSNLSSAIRLYVLRFYRSQIPDPPTLRVFTRLESRGWRGRINEPRRRDSRDIPDISMR